MYCLADHADIPVALAILYSLPDGISANFLKCPLAMDNA